MAAHQAVITQAIAQAAVEATKSSGTSHAHSHSLK